MTTKALAPTVQEAGSLAETRELMHRKLEGIVPDIEIETKVDLVFEINRLKHEKNAVILGHNYMEPALFHTVPDYVGDSLQLSRVAASTEAGTIIFCGVQFMAETAKVLSPSKNVLIPSEKAGCSLSEGITAEDMRNLKEAYPKAVTVTYVNTNADVKAESDYACTSGNAKAVVTHLLEKGHKQIVFVPDEFLAHNTANELGLKFIMASTAGGESDDEINDNEAVIIGWKAHCEVHELFTIEDVENARKQYPGVVILAHPECKPEVLEKCDIAGSTKAMVDYLRDKEAPCYLLLTECAMGDNMAIQFPEREMVRACSYRCEHMNIITLEDTLASLKNTQYKVELPDEIITNARKCIDRMISIG